MTKQICFKLRPWQLSDLESLVQSANNSNIARNLTDAFPSPYTREDGEKYLKMVCDENPTNVFAIEVNGEAVGSISVLPQTDIHQLNAEMGYFLAESLWGKGIMPEAVKQVVKYVFETFDITRIYARPFGRNLASQRVLEKAGFQLEARFEKVLIKNGQLEDELVYAIRKE